MKKEFKRLKDFFEANGFNVFLTKQDGNQCAEVENWTDGGVDMIIWLNPFTVEEFIKYVDDFDIDSEIETNRQDKTYVANFTITESVRDFESYHNNLKELVVKLKTDKNLHKK